MSDLTEFLLARIAEDEALAREALERASVYGDREVTWKWLRGAGGSTMWEPTNHTPARVLAECDAKRRIVEFETDEDLVGVGEPEDRSVLRYLALPYADHPDFREEWRV